MADTPSFLAALAARRRFGMKPGLDTIRALGRVLGNPQSAVPALHIAGTNGKGAVAALLDSCLRAAGFRTGRYTSPHLVSLNERFFLDGRPVPDALLETYSARVGEAIGQADDRTLHDLTFFEALTAVAFLLYAREKVDFCVLETGLGGRLDATNICSPVLTVISRIGLDHCDWLGDTVEKIAAEKAGIIKPGVPIVLGKNEPSVSAVIKARAEAVGAPFHYAPDLATEADIPAGYALAGSFNRENAVTALAALRVLSLPAGPNALTLDRFNSLTLSLGFASVVWPGRFQRIGRCLVDGAHNPPAARALATALTEGGYRDMTLICGFCADKEVEETLRILKPYVSRAFAVKTNNPRSLSPEDLAQRLGSVGIPSTPCSSLHEALAKSTEPPTSNCRPSTLICGSLFLAGEAVVTLGAYPWQTDEGPRFDPSELLRVK